MNGLLVVLFELPLTTWSRRFPSRAAMAAGYVLMGSSIALNAVFHSLPALVAAMILFTVGEMLYAPVAGAYLTSLAPPRMRGRYMGAWGFSNSLSLAVAPSIGLFVFARSPAALWLGCGVMGVLAALTITAGNHRPEPAPARALPAQE
jgi:MFS family permease